MTQPTPNKPVDDVRIGRVKATIWRNETEDGKPRFNTVFARLYKDGDTWQSTSSFGRNDLLLLAKVANLAHTRVCKLSGRTTAMRTTARPRSSAEESGGAAYAASPLCSVRLFPHPTCQHTAWSSPPDSPNTGGSYARALPPIDAWRSRRPMDDFTLAAYLPVLYDTGRTPSRARHTAEPLGDCRRAGPRRNHTTTAQARRRPNGNARPGRRNKSTGRRSRSTCTYLLVQRVENSRRLDLPAPLHPKAAVYGTCTCLRVFC